MESECALLRDAGHEVEQWIVSNDDLVGMGPIALGRTALWSPRASALKEVLRGYQPDVLHLHNTLPLLSPSSIAAAWSAGVPVVQTLHNYRLICPAGTLFRDGRPCEACVGRAVPLAGIRSGCYRDSSAASGAVAAASGLQRLLQRAGRGVSRYIVLTEFARARFVAGGLPADTLSIKPNFAFPNEGVDGQPREGLLFVGRHSPEKGLETLLEAWALAGGGPRLTIVGDGPLSSELKGRALALGARWLGAVARSEVLAMMRRHLALVVPSRWYEGFPMVVVEGFAAGLPAIVSRLGSLEEIVRAGATGWYAPPGDAPGLAAVLRHVLAHPEEALTRGAAAREAWRARYAPQENLARLEHIYDEARRVRAAGGGCEPFLRA